MTRRTLSARVVVVGLLVVLSPVLDLTAAAARADGPLAICGPGDKPETGLQGQVPLADQLSGRAREGYSCGVREIGRSTVEDRGGNGHLTWWRKGRHTCAYLGSADRPVTDPLTGVAVIDATNKDKPKTTAILQDPGSYNIIETLNAKSGVLVAKGTDATQQNPFHADTVALYDISKDCRHPRHTASFKLPTLTHGGGLSPDGKTLYAQSYVEETFVYDISNLSKPRLLVTAPFRAHDMAFNLDGTRVYFADGRIFDTTSIHRRKLNPEMRLIAEPEGAGGHTAVYARVKGRSYLLTSREQFYEGTCTEGGMNVVNFDITDEAKPKKVSEFKLEVNEPNNCLGATLQDRTTYGSHYGGVDDPRNATFAMWTWFGSGTRIFDIRDMTRPREVAFFNPGTRDVGRMQWTAGGPALCGPVECTVPYPHYIPHARQIWTSSLSAGLQILSLAPQVRKALGLR